MDQETLNYFRQKLLDWKKSLLDELGVTIGEKLQRDPQRQGDFGDMANIESDQNFLLRIRDRERKLISKIDGCLRKIDNGTYGLCEMCGDDIERKRLEARPVASLCIACKIEQEKHER